MSYTDPLILLWSFFLTGLSVGFGHCIGMCGPIAISLSLHLKGKSVWLPQLLYHLGRVITYGVLGALMGLTGAFTGTAARLAGIQKWMLIFAGLLIIVMGLLMAGWLPIGRIFRSDEDVASPGLIDNAFQKLSASHSLFSYLMLGLLLGLLPCGPVYTALVAAAGSGMAAPSHLIGTVTGSSLMIAFGIGTIPAMLIVARLAGIGAIIHRVWIYRISALIMVLLGIGFIYKGARW